MISSISPVADLNPTTKPTKDEVLSMTARLFGGLCDADVDALMARLDQLKLERIKRELENAQRLREAAQSELIALRDRCEHLVAAVRLLEQRGVVLAQAVQS